MECLEEAQPALALRMLTVSCASRPVILSKAKDLSAIAENGKAIASSQMRKPSSQRKVAEGRTMACTSGNNANDAAAKRAPTTDYRPPTTYF